jgi:riboflavin transporter FmnP
MEAIIGFPSGNAAEVVGNALKVTVAGITASPSTLATSISSTNVSTVTQVLKAANSSRVGLSIQNDAAVPLYVALAATAATGTYTVQVPSLGLYELPFPVYIGTIAGISTTTAGGGGARVTEFTA